MSKRSHEFRAEVRQLLDLVVHSLYSHKEIFLRELISNASDAIDKARYRSLTESVILEGEKEFRIKIIADKEAGTLTVRDNGIGMTVDEAVEELGTIAHSGTRQFLRALKEGAAADNPELIGQFGVGFYAAFMVADRVTVESRKAGENPSRGVRWESSADGSFSVEEIEKPAKGTDVVLHLKEDAKMYLEEGEIRQIVRTYSDYIEHPIVMDVEKEIPDEKDPQKKTVVTEEATLNSRRAIWLKRPAEVADEEYGEFYRQISHGFGDPAKVVHFKAEGTSEFTALLFVPAKAPFGILYPDFKTGPALYVRRVQIMNHCEDLLPLYLRFVSGVVDSSDLPLNVSREMLQNNRQVEVIKKNITKKVLDALREMKEHQYDAYVAFHRELGRVLKEGVHYDFARREAIADLLLFQSTMTGPEEFTTLQRYVENMREGQDDIYYMVATSREEAVRSPYLEAFRESGREVLILLDEIDDIIMGSLGQYKGKRLRSAVKGDLPLDEKKSEEAREKFGGLLDFIKGGLGERVKDVRFSGRLTDSPCCLVSDEGGLDPHTERILRAMGQEVPPDKRILELNPSHPVLEAMEALFEKDREDPLLAEYAGLLYGQALLLAGSMPEDPSEFAKRLTVLMTESARRASGGRG